MPIACASFCCGSCFDPLPLQSLICGAKQPPQAQAASRYNLRATLGRRAAAAAAAGCGHYYCAACLRVYLASLLRGHKFPVRCPYVGERGQPCPCLLPPLTVQELLEGLDEGAKLVGG